MGIGSRNYFIIFLFFGIYTTDIQKFSGHLPIPYFQSFNWALHFVTYLKWMSRAIPKQSLRIDFRARSLKLMIEWPSSSRSVLECGSLRLEDLDKKIKENKAVG